MSTEDARLEQDLKIVEAMAAEMEEYLRSEVLFWQMMPGGMPKLTLGGYLMRQHRLLALRDLLDEEQQARLDAAVAQFNHSLVEKVVRFEQRAHRELEARVRQWSEYLRDIEQDSGSSAANYNSAVETRAMMAALVDQLKTPPYQLEPRRRQQVELLDRSLRMRWKPGEFVWLESWQPAYPRTAYWWLYGRPR